jgi:protein SCO1/2
MNKSILYIVSALLVLVLAGFFLGIQLNPLPKYGQFPTYPLTDLSGQAYHFGKDKIKIITFFYTNCPDICPITMDDLKQLYEELEQKSLLDEDVDILTITLDPTNDTEKVLTEYSNKFNIPSNGNWYFLRGTNEQITKLTDELGFYREETGGYWSHSTTIYLVDYENRKRTFHLMATPNEPLNIEKIIEEIRLLKKEHQKVVNK